MAYIIQYRCIENHQLSVSSVVSRWWKKMSCESIMNQRSWMGMSTNLLSRIFSNLMAANRDLILEIHHSSVFDLCAQKINERGKKMKKSTPHDIDQRRSIIFENKNFLWCHFVYCLWIEWMENKSKKYSRITPANRLSLACCLYNIRFSQILSWYVFFELAFCFISRFCYLLFACAWCFELMLHLARSDF